MHQSKSPDPSERNKCSKRKMVILKSLYYFFKTWGLAPMRFNTDSSESERVRSLWCTGSKKGQGYNAVLSCLIAVTNCYMAHIVFDYNLSVQLFDKTFDVVHYIYTTITAVVIVMVFCFCQGNAVSIANNLKIMYMLITNINRRLSKEEEPALGSLKRIGIMTTVIWLLVIFTSAELYLAVVLYYVTVYPCISIINCAFLQYSIILKLLTQLFAILNANFRYLSRQSVVSIKVVSTDSSHPASKESTQPFADLCELYASLCDLSMDVSKFYHPVMLFCISYIFITLTMWMYYITGPFVMGNVELSVLDYVHTFMILMHHIFMLIILTKSVDAVVHESKKTGEITNRWLANLENQHTVNELNLFSNYLLHKNVSFTVYRLFSLDESLLMSITGSMTTYLIIILQFRSTDQKEK